MEEFLDTVYSIRSADATTVPGRTYPEVNLVDARLCGPRRHCFPLYRRSGGSSSGFAHQLGPEIRTGIVPPPARPVPLPAASGRFSLPVKRCARNALWNPSRDIGGTAGSYADCDQYRTKGERDAKVTVSAHRSLDGRAPAQLGPG